MIKWFIDKQNKVPLYLQLKDQINYYISTGAVQAGYRLPPVSDLAGELGINFETVRKAYKELERDGLIRMQRGHGTFITLPGGSAGRAAARTHVGGLHTTGRTANGNGAGPLESFKRLVRTCLEEGSSVPAVKKLFAQAVAEVTREDTQTVIFTECNQWQVREITELLSKELRYPVKPVLLSALKEKIRALPEEAIKTTTIITTGFHISEVRDQAWGLPINVEVLITNMAPETRRRLDAFGKRARYGFICRDQESAALYKDLLKVELENKDLNLVCCTLAETDKVGAMLKSVDVLLVSPPVYEAVRKLAPRRLAVFNVFERVDPMSLRVVKERLSATCPSAKIDQLKSQQNTS
jgi:DNA-binding transcriptional regulator YhcF (GntR family)